jgi:hypothetical protein
MKKQLSPGVVVVIIIVVLVIIAAIWFFTYGKKPAKTGWQGPVPKAEPPSGGGPPMPGAGGPPMPAGPGGAAPAPPAAPPG